MKEHTALPWRIGDTGTTVFGPPNGNPSPVTVAYTSRENAAYIAKACNSFPQLVAALTEITDRFERLERLYFEATRQVPDGENGSVVRARAALKEAKGEQ